MSAFLCSSSRRLCTFYCSLTELTILMDVSVDFLRSGAADQQENADGEEDKEEVGLHAALRGSGAPGETFLHSI